MLLPILILAVRLSIFFTANLLNLITFVIAFSVIGVISGGFLMIFVFPFWIILPFWLTTVIHRKLIKKFDSMTIPTWLPGKKYLTWRKQIREQQNQKRLQRKWFKSFDLSSVEGLKATSIVLLSVILSASFGMRLALFAGNPGKAFAYFVKSEMGAWLLFFVIVIYGIDTWISWNKNQTRWQGLKKQPSHKIVSDDISDELSELTQLNPKQNPEDKKRRN